MILIYICISLLRSANFKANRYQNRKYSIHQELFPGDAFKRMLYCKRLSDLSDRYENLVRDILFIF